MFAYISRTEILNSCFIFLDIFKVYYREGFEHLFFFTNECNVN